MSALLQTKSSLTQKKLLNPLISRQECVVFGINMYRNENGLGWFPNKGHSFASLQSMVRSIR